VIARIVHVEVLTGLGTDGFNTALLGEGGIDLHNLYFIIRDAIGFLHQEALKLPDATPDEGRNNPCV
jgi:hypothetical protein